MADTDITEAQLKTELGSVKTYIRAGDFASARKELACAGVTLTRLCQMTGQAGQSVSYRNDLEGLIKIVDQAEKALAKSSDNQKRFIRARTGFGL